MSKEPLEKCPLCGKEISFDEYMVYWASCSDCFNAHYEEYLRGAEMPEHKQLWPGLNSNMKINGMVKVDIYQDNETGKPILQLEIGNIVVCVTANIAEMIGGAAIGARKRWEDHQ
jgi:hypothetical protein